MLNQNSTNVGSPLPMVDFSQFSSLKDYITEYSAFESDYIFSHLTSEAGKPAFINSPISINGLIFCFVVSGEMKIDINLNSYDIGANTLVTASAASIINMREICSDNFDAYVLIISPDFMRDINIDLNVIQASKIQRPDSPLMDLSQDESTLLLKYLELLHLNTKGNQDSIYIRSISRCLLASITYQLLQFAVKRNQESSEEKHAPLTRRSSYVRDFMELVHRHHKEHRSVAFYAEKLFITPKYLSLIIKESTGRSAAEWIDEFVILEAKNLLRFSRKNIQQIAYELNFSNQSSFGKYFKNLTGMSPSVYQRS